MEDIDLLKHIEQLVNEEHGLTQQSGLDEAGHRRMHQLAISLDQCWDLLRQRRALRSAHLNPDEAQVRDADIVEHYKQ
ncbi:MAG: DUF2630 family protein [Ktedonobacteraceae bacterium]